MRDALVLSSSRAVAALHAATLLALCLAACTSAADSPQTSQDVQDTGSATPDAAVDAHSAPDAAAAPTVTGVQPPTGRPLGGELVIVTGTGFVAGANVRFGGVEAPGLELIDATSLRVLTPPLTPGAKDVEVTVPGGGNGVLPGGYTIGALDLHYAEVPSFAFPGLVAEDSQAAVAADWDGDGDEDLVVVADGLPTLLRNDGNGNFAAPGGGEPEPPGDVDAGGTDAGGDAGGDTLGDAGGTTDTEMTPDAPAPVVVPPARAALALDLDTDGCLDLVVTHGDRWRPYAGDCGGGLVASDVLLPNDPGDLGVLVARDVDGDGTVDLLVADRDPAAGTPNRLYLGAAKTGVFIRADGTWMPPHAEATAALVLADVDGDGHPDLITGNMEASDGVTLRLLLQSGGRFVDAPAGMLPGVDGPVTALAGGDVDGDGDVDLVIIRPAAQDRLLRNDGHGFFFDDTLASMPVDVSDGVQGVLRDLDLDGDMDLLIANDLQQDRLYLSADTGRMQDHTPLLPLRLDPTRGILPFDADRDGDLDLFFLEGAGVPNRLLLCVQEGGQ